MEKKAHQSCVTCPGRESWRIPSQTCPTGKPRFLPHMPLRCLPGGFLEPASPSSQLAQNMGCGPYPSPLSTVSSVLAAPGPAESRVRAQCGFSAMWPRTRLLAPRLGWGCRGNALPLDCLVGPTSHWNVSEIPPFRPPSKPPLPGSHSHYEQQENLFRSCPDFQFGKQMATIARPPYGLYFPLPFHSVLSLSVCPRARGAYRHRHSLSSNCSSSTSHTFDLGLVLGFDFLRLQGDDNNHICILDFSHELKRR